MPQLEPSKVTPSKLLSGGGDGLRSDGIKPRTPIPSCRRFAARYEKKEVREKLEKAIQEFKTPQIPSKRPALPRRSATMAEITPSKRTPKKKLPIDELTSSSATSAKRSKNDAGRRVYQQILLNSWRRKRSQVSTLVESSRKLQEQNNQLEMQIDVLQKLRENESRRRSQAFADSLLLKDAMENQQIQIQDLNQEKAQAETKIVDLEMQVDELKTEVQNTKNDWMAVMSELKLSEQQITKEREKIGRLRRERESLIEKMTQKEGLIGNQNDTIKYLQVTLQNTESNLRNSMENSANLEEEKQILTTDLENEKKTTSLLELQLEESKITIQKLEKKIADLKRSLAESKESNKKVKDDNQLLKKHIQELQDVLAEERKRPWWRNATDLAKVPLSAIQSAAFVMLPALPQHLNKATSTTEVFK